MGQGSLALHMLSHVVLGLLSYVINLTHPLKSIIFNWFIFAGYFHGASCLQANDVEGRKDDRLKEKERERKENLTRMSTIIYRKKGGSCLNCRANNVSSG